MNCPKCKYDNPPGASYCGLCYEVLNRSAADAYLRGMQRERLKAQRDQQREAEHPIQSLMNNAEQLARRIDWGEMASALMDRLRRGRRALLWILGGLGGFLLLYLLSYSSSLFHRWTGTRLEYDFSGKAPVKYLVGYHIDLKSWSERQGNLDTPFAPLRIDELGNLLVQKSASATADGQTLVMVRPQEWIEIEYAGDAGRSRSIPPNHPTLTPASVRLDRRGTVQQRYFKFSPRLSKCLDFLMPGFPPGGLRPGRRWTEPVQWVDVLDDWRILWTGELHWRLSGETDCGQDRCVQLFYQADLRPQLRGAPSWAVGAIGAPRFDGKAQGDALFLSGRKRLYANTLKYDGTLRIPLNDLGRIPIELRVGRPVRGVPGAILLQLHNRIDIRKS